MSYVVSRLQVINNVLAELGESSVAIEDASANSTFIKERINALLPYVLSKGNFRFNLVYREDSTPAAQPLSGQYQYTFTLPSDYGRMYRMLNRTQYEEIQGGLATDSQTIQYYYNTNGAPFFDGNFEGMSPPFVEALTFYVVSRVAAPLTENLELKKIALESFNAYIADAILMNEYEINKLISPPNEYDRVVYS